MFALGASPTAAPILRGSYGAPGREGDRYRRRGRGYCRAALGGGKNGGGNRLLGDHDPIQLTGDDRAVRAFRILPREAGEAGEGAAQHGSTDEFA
jgi:hypothetical protein